MPSDHDWTHLSPPEREQKIKDELVTIARTSGLDPRDHSVMQALESAYWLGNYHVSMGGSQL